MLINFLKNNECNNLIKVWQNKEKVQWAIIYQKDMLRLQKIEFDLEFNKVMMRVITEVYQNNEKKIKVSEKVNLLELIYQR